MRWLVLVFGLELPALLAWLDCRNREQDHFEGGAPDRAAWLRWLVVAMLTVPLFGLGYGIVLGYFWAVVRRNTPGRT